MTALEPPRRRPRAFWSDARFFLGIVLIAASVAGVWFVVGMARQTTPVYAAARTIVPGQTLTADDLRVVEVALGQLGESYVGADALRAGMVAVRTIASGELVPHSAVGAPDAATTTTVVLRSAVDVPGSVVPGTTVEVWAAPLRERGVYDAPRILVADATVVSVTRDDSMIGGGAASLELVIPRADVAAALAAMSDQSALSVVPSAGGR
ncbi:SAF domain-containing protein [Microbacterium sp. CJ88]|uniref:SAF domain-containing protein n=1 Tax=Microbacterium sp. CJ88 TaxID=3445672 RepID=UPI003F657767